MSGKWNVAERVFYTQWLNGQQHGARVIEHIEAVERELAEATEPRSAPVAGGGGAVDAEDADEEKLRPAWRPTPDELNGGRFTAGQYGRVILDERCSRHTIQNVEFFGLPVTIRGADALALRNVFMHGVAQPFKGMGNHALKIAEATLCSFFDLRIEGTARGVIIQPGVGGVHDCTFQRTQVRHTGIGHNDGEAFLVEGSLGECARLSVMGLDVFAARGSTLSVWNATMTDGVFEDITGTHSGPVIVGGGDHGEVNNVTIERLQLTHCRPNRNHALLHLGQFCRHTKINSTIIAPLPGELRNDRVADQASMVTPAADRLFKDAGHSNTVKLVTA